jgi:hypothetical protein
MRRSSLERRLGCVERVLAARRRTHHLWQETDEPYATVQARKRAMIASGEASPLDKFIIFRWTPPAGDGL